MTKIAKNARVVIIRNVLEGMHEGLSLRKSCLAAGTNTPTFLGWVNVDRELAEQYAHAREALLDKIADDTLHYADEAVGTTDNGSTDSGAVAKQRLQVDTRKWLLSKLAPKKYGDKLLSEHVGANGGPIQLASMSLSGLTDAELATMKALALKSVKAEDDE